MTQTLSSLTITPTPLKPADTWPAASAALKRLDELRTLLAIELRPSLARAKGC
ncbi:putative cysteine peptidase toxin [Pseudomonas syringae pv. maculicola]|uniref:Cysteine peptidase toxin n=2 Tax=Pseudomonas savastanoi TaxID=29438 RepID=A0A0P9XTD8_PSESH|nr:putative cysteine peptidase toxin [Pseudomonas savastanoi pv. phaseolicola]KPB64517.1 putative cysteine peptidase toxin [Pseudomonas amygdali pv. mellea]KPB87465.1 putative cysteine peptidase toxin [Pseudomonas syringae pv. maculicola]RMM61555.1 putative cysteine peptidase toxin [Pseudomonas savastanoi pv. glycinea]KPB36293.1 putative cysteine peptidase toxin [Pseudomonas savastanoi pv. phaseolicola]